MNTQLKLDPKERLKIVIESSTPLVVIETVEELRALQMIRAAALELQLPVFEWSVADGLARAGATVPGGGVPAAPGRPREETEMERKLAVVNASLAQANLPPLNLITGKEQFANESAPPPVYNTKDAAAVLQHLESLTIEAVFVLKDLHRHLDTPIVVRLLREVANEFSGDRRTLVLTAPRVVVPPELENQVEYIELPMPDRARLRAIIEETFKRLSAKRTLARKLDAAGIESMAANLSGLTEQEAERTAAQAIVARYGLVPESTADVLEAKRDILRRSGMLEFIPATDDLSTVGGLENLKSWLRKRRAAFSEAARASGLEPPRGVVILGVQGCGKSMCARCIAGEWKLPLVKFDVAAIFDKYIGETEKRIQKMFRIAEQLAPCVLWIDELEKVFAGSNPESASNDAGTSARLLGAFLSWMQDRKAPVFVAATSNNVKLLPPELIRKGRFDEIFFVDLPNAEERAAVFVNQLRRRHLDPKKFDVKSLADATAGYSGAEIDSGIQSAMYACFSEQTQISTESIRREIIVSVPLSRTRAEDIQQLRAWAAERAVPATGSVAAAAGGSSG
jgi:hypothetical protein